MRQLTTEEIDNFSNRHLVDSGRIKLFLEEMGLDEIEALREALRRACYFSWNAWTICAVREGITLAKNNCKNSCTNV